MALYLTGTIEGETLLARRFEGLATGLADMQQPLTQAADYLIEFTSGEVFDTEGGAIDYQWEPLAETTLAEKTKRGYPEQPLVRTGDMRDSFSSEVTSGQAIIFNEMPYFMYHQSAEPRHSNLPRRVMLALENAQIEEIVKIVQQYIQNAAKKGV